jgi:hypothetical protein
MRKHFLIGAMSALAAALCVAQGARADTTSFNDIPRPALPSLYTHFQNNFYDGGLRFQDNAFDVLPTGVDHRLTGQTSSVMETGSTDTEPLTISAYTGNPSHDGATGTASAIDFNLWYLKLGLGYLTTGASDTLTVSGFAAGGCDPYAQPLTCHASVTQDFTVTAALTLEQLTGFTNLGWVQISRPLLSDGVTVDPGWLAVDDLVHTAVLPQIENTNPGPPAADPLLPGVPEPSGWALMIVGFGGIGVLLRRNRRAVITAA